MTRSIEQIYNDMIAEKQSMSTLNGLLPSYSLSGMTPDNPLFLLLQKISSGSKVAIWKLFIWITAAAIYTHEALWEVFKVEVDTLAKSSQAGTLKWYADNILKFQYGFALIWDAATYRYFYSDVISQAATDARIVKKVSVTEVVSGGTTALSIKAAKLSGGVLAPLDNTSGSELDTLKVYVNRIKFAGVKTVVTSLNPDKARLKLKIFYDGVLDLIAFKAAVEVALKQYLNDIDFDGIFYTNKLIDAMQALPGVADVYVLGTEFQPYGGSFASASMQYAPASGYFELVPLGTTSSDTQISYEAI